MKSAKQIWLGLVLVMITALIFSGCGKKDNPFAPSSDGAAGVAGSNLTSVGDLTITPATAGSLADLKPDSAGIQGEIVIVFADYMDAATINLTNIEVEGIGTTGVIKYYPEIKKAVIQGTWTNNNFYKITIKTGLHNKGGMPIDGNGNGKFDGSPYDEYVTYFETGTASGPDPDLVHPYINYWWMATSNPQPRWPEMYINFIGTDMDTTLIKSNFSLKDSAGNSVNIRISYYNGLDGWVGFTPTNAVDSLDYNTLYKVTINVNSLADTNGNSVIWGYYGYVPNVPNYCWSFRTVGQSGDYTPLHYNSYSVLTASNELRVTFDDSLDMSTINSTNVKLYKTIGGVITSAVSGRIYTMPDDISARRFRFTLENAASGNYRLYINRNIKDNAGLFLDGNGNGISGEAGDPAMGTSSDDVTIDFSR